jgi:curved DNA-binding protein CbpA/transcription elongation factor Elf1
MKIIESRELRLHGVFECPSCRAKCIFDIVEASPSTPATEYVKCYLCSILFQMQLQPADSHLRILPQSINVVSNNNNGTNGQRSNEQQQSSANDNEKEKVKMDGTYYEVLGVEKTAAADQIKRAFYKLAMRYHPDKYSGPDPDANEERFKRISAAYQVLSDETLRERYDRYGAEEGAQSTDVAGPFGGDDPEKFFQKMFGGDAFVDLIGDLTISRDFGDVISSSSGGGGGASDPSTANVSSLANGEERERRRKERVNRLAQNLLQKISYYCDHEMWTSTAANNSAAVLQARIKSEFEQRIADEAQELKNSSYGVELLRAIGYMYTLKANQWLGREDTLFGIGKWWNDIREKGHVISETVGTIRSAVELQAALSKLEQQQQQDKDETADDTKSKPAASGTKKAPMTEEEKAFWEQRAAEKGMDTLWKGSKMEIEGVVKDVCDQLLLTGPLADLPKEVLRRRAHALRIIGRIYESVQPDPSNPTTAR